MNLFKTAHDRNVKHLSMGGSKIKIVNSAVVAIFAAAVILSAATALPGTVTDIDGNVYQTVTIGTQVWMAENLKVTHYRNGDAIPNVTDGPTWAGLTTGAYCEYDNNINNVVTYGRLYNWFAVADSRNIAPAGWHVPSDAEWKQLEMYLGMSQAEADATGWRGNDEGGKLKEAGTTHWMPDNVGATNESGFTALPGGYRYDVGYFDSMGYLTVYWSSTEDGSYSSWVRLLSSYYSEVYRPGSNWLGGISVRCVKDEEPTLTTADVSDVMETTAQCGGAITSDGGAAVIARGVCWSTNPTPTVTDDTTNDGTGMGSFASSITGLTGKTTYYVRAYATNSAGTGYGNEVSFITTDSMGTVTDIDDNSYRTVKIGDQWWMAENLKVTHYRNGDTIPNVTDGPTWVGLTTGAYCEYDNEINNVVTYGRLYNWYAVNDGRNIAPAGWHVATDAEWQALVDYLGGNAVAGGKLKETGTTHWMSPNTGATNESGFSALPGGFRYDYGGFLGMGSTATFWSSAEYNSNDAWYRTLHYYESEVRRNNYPKQSGFSVRCVKDPIDLNLLYISPTQSFDSELVVPLRFNCQTPTAAFQIGLCWPPGFELLDVSFAGTAVENWGFKNFIIDNENQNVLIYAAVGQDFDYILTGEDTVLAYLHFANPLNTYDSVCILEPYISTDSLPLVLDTCTINGEGLLFLDTFKIPEPGVFYPNVMFDTSWAYSYPDYAYTPGNVNADFNTAGEPVINLVDILYVINFVYGNPAGPAPIPPSSGDVNGDCVVNLLDILLLINCKYGNPPVCDFVCGCVESSPLNKIGSTMQKYSDAPYGGEVSTEYADGKTIIMLAAVDVIKGIDMEIRLPDISANVSCPIESMQVYSRQENDMIKLALFDINGQYQIDKGKIILLEIDGPAEIMSAFAGGQHAAALYLEVAGSAGVSPTVPTRFVLHQNHPNPFNPATQISFELPAEAHVTLDVYNIMGQKVSTVADRKFAPGYHTVEWDGSSFASGVYFYRIQADDAIETRKMMLLK